MEKFNCKISFSSSATVYGIPKEIPTPEDAEIKPLNPYGETKAAMKTYSQTFPK